MIRRAGRPTAYTLRPTPRPGASRRGEFGPDRRWRAVAHRGRASADERLAAELAAGKTVRGAADAAGVSERTAFRRLADDRFTSRVADLRGQMVARAAGHLADGMAEAADALR